MRALHRLSTILAALVISAAISVRAARADEPLPSPSASPPALPPCRVVDASVMPAVTTMAVRWDQLFAATKSSNFPMYRSVKVTSES